jgi:hypothetical protein
MVQVEVWLYGPLARYHDPENAIAAQVRMELPEGSRLRDLLAGLKLPTEERGITFINGNLSAMPGIQPDLECRLEEGDRIAFFHLKSMWPFQYRDGAAMAPELAERLSRKT